MQLCRKIVETIPFPSTTEKLQKIQEYRIDTPSLKLRLETKVLKTIKDINRHNCEITTSNSASKMHMHAYFYLEYIDIAHLYSRRPLAMYYSPHFEEKSSIIIHQREWNNAQGLY